MKRIFALISVFVLVLSFSACSRTERQNFEENTSYFSSAQSESTVSETENSASAARSSEQTSEQSAPAVKREFYSDIHEWDENNVLYNINNTYELTDRYYMPFEWEQERAVLWKGAGNVPALGEKYDPEQAVTFAREHWNDGLDVCAPFISRCLKAGGLSVGSDSSTALCLMLVNSRLGFGQFLPMNSDKTVTLPKYAREGDIIQLYCSYEGLMVHSMIVVGFDEEGRAKVCCHNPKNSGEYALKYTADCASCLLPLTEVFYFHFYADSEEQPAVFAKDEDILLYEDNGYIIPNQHYDRVNAIECVKYSPTDGIGQFGAEQTSAALAAGGINVGVPIQTALFMQLMKSRLGTMYSLPIEPDRTVILPDFVKEGDICFLYCPEEAMFYSSFVIKGADSHGKMVGYTRDRINNEYNAFKVESVCPSSVCDAEIAEVVVYCFGEENG